MKPSERYIIIYDWMLQKIGGTTACTLYALLYSFTDEQGNVQMAHGYMMNRLHASERVVKYALAELTKKGHIQVVTTGRGKGVCTLYNLPDKRVQNCILLDTPKGDKNVPLYDAKRVQNCTLKKGTILYPNNNINNNNSPALQESNTHTHEGMEDYGFSTFWELFKPAAEFTNLRRACCQAWAEATEPQREQILAELRRNEPHRQNPLYHIRYFGENRASADAPELLTMQQVYARFNTTEPKGWCVLAVEFEAPDKARWCKIEDAERKGYPIRRKWA
jgi:hypothetical protein